MTDTEIPQSPVIGTAELAAALDSAQPPVLLDIRYKLGGPPGIGWYREGHLPGAHFVDMDTRLSTPVSDAAAVEGRHPLPGADAFAAAMRAAGVSADRDVVAYDIADGIAAARAWWLLRYFGHDRVRVLDGGFAAWTAAGLPVTTDVPEPEHGDFTAKPGSLPLLDADQAARLAREGVLIDVRAAERFRGETEPIDPVAGHIPGAVNAPETEALGPDGLLLPAAELRARYAALGAVPGAAVGAYCGSGVTAAHAVLVLERSGVPGVALYAPSWSGWIADPERPIATGE
ncbi:sulfurtransferase [Yinghuangia soli]|uniref:Sulfurtransferase n=1 Tax=Yinghuangia soli TaxID=2908204 RepID=A0AA41PWB1_9ACTN|nr:sulfurtransferase [Yinghuangia soli]MCF2526386.1 sulfurtransferase [Yinghuangia soli]